MNAPVNQSKNIRKKFDKTFKQHAVESGSAAARRPRKWPRSWGFIPKGWGLEEALRAAAPRGEGGGGAKRSAEQLEAENTGLRRENDYLRQQRDILKKTLGILSEPPSNVFNGLTR